MEGPSPCAASAPQSFPALIVLSGRSYRPGGDRLLTSAYDDAAPTFDCYRALPIGVPEAIRAAILNSISASSRPHLLDLGAGSGRIGWPFVVAGDDYVGVDLSSGMLREFAQRAATRGGVSPRLVQADGQLLPFRDATFD